MISESTKGSQFLSHMTVMLLSTLTYVSYDLRLLSSSLLVLGALYYSFYLHAWLHHAESFIVRVAMCSGFLLFPTVYVHPPEFIFWFVAIPIILASVIANGIVIANTNNWLSKDDISA